MKFTSFIAFIIAITSAGLLQGAILEVPSGSYPTIQSAIDAAVSGDTISVDDGVYFENLVIEYKNVKVVSKNGFGAATINGMQAGPAVYFYQVNNTALLEGFTVKNGDGSGIFCLLSGPTINSNRITANTTFSRSVGSGIFCSYASPTITKNVIDQNLADSLGGGIHCYFSNAIIKNNNIQQNEATYAGGGIYCHESQAVIEDNSIFSNTAAFEGGGIALYSNSDATLSKNLIHTNDSGNDGGGIYINDSHVTVADNEIYENTAVYNGGGITCFNFADPIILRNLIHHNSSQSAGGGISCHLFSNPKIINNMIYGNETESSGGGIHLSLSSAVITNNTVVDNNVVSISDESAHGGGIACVYQSTGVEIFNTIIYGNSAPANSGLDLYVGDTPNPSDVIVNHCNIPGQTLPAVYNDGSTIHWTNPITTEPTFVDKPNGDLHLLAGCACIDAGNPAATDLPPNDFEGDLRDAQPDIGADEYISSSKPPTITGVSPHYGPDAGSTTITITGTNFDVGTIAITIGGTPVLSPLYVSPTEYKCDTPAKAYDWYDVQLSNNDGATTLPDGFRYYPTTLFDDRPFNGMDIKTDSLNNPVNVEILLTGTAGDAMAICLSTGQGPTWVGIDWVDLTFGPGWKLMGIAPLNGQGFLSIPATIPGGTPGLDVYVHCVDIVSLRWAYGGGNTNGGIWLHLNN